MKGVASDLQAVAANRLSGDQVVTQVGIISALTRIVEGLIPEGVRSKEVMEVNSAQPSDFKALSLTLLELLQQPVVINPLTKRHPHPNAGRSITSNRLLSE